MKNSLWLCTALLIAFMLCGCASHSKKGEPAFKPPAFKTKPQIAVIDNTPGIYYTPENLNVFYFEDNWYYFCEGIWFGSYSYAGPWGYIPTHQLPIQFGLIPPKYLRPMEEQKMRR